MSDNGIAKKQTYITIKRLVDGKWVTEKRIPNKLKRSKNEVDK